MFADRLEQGLSADDAMLIVYVKHAHARDIIAEDSTLNYAMAFSNQLGVEWLFLEPML